MVDELSRRCFAEPEVPNVAPGRYSSSLDQIGWLDQSSVPRARKTRTFLNRSLSALPAVAAGRLCNRLRNDPPFGRVYFEVLVGRFLQVLGAEVEHEPTGVGGMGVDWRARFPSGAVAFVEATSPVYNQRAYRERRRREALLGVIEEEMPAGWWVAPRTLPRIGLSDSRRPFRRVVHSVLSNLPDPAGYSIRNRLVLEARVRDGQIVLELWPGHPTDSPIAFASMGAYTDDSALRVAVAARAKRDQARAFPGELVLLAIDGPFGGPDVEDFDQALLGQTIMHLGIDRQISHYSFRPNGVLASQRAAEYAGVLAFGRVGISGANDPILYRHPRYEGSLPRELHELRQRFLDGGAIRDAPPGRTGIMSALRFPDIGND